MECVLWASLRHDPSGSNGEGGGIDSRKVERIMTPDGEGKTTGDISSRRPLPALYGRLLN